ncbi:hypothetical protein D3C72_943960 [compost metagenome]
MRAHPLQQRVGQRRHPAFEQLPRRTQPAHAHAQLVHVFGIAGAVDAFGIHFSQHRGVARDLVQAFGGDAAQGLRRRHVFAQLDRSRAAWRPELGNGLGAARFQVIARLGVFLGKPFRQLRQRIATFGFAARVQHQAVPLLPAARNSKDGGGAARHQFKFQFRNGQFQRARAQDAGVVGQFNRAVARAHFAQQAQHVGFVAQAQLALDRAQRRFDFGAGIHRQVQHGAGPGVVHFDAGDGVDAGHLQRLHPIIAFLAQADGDARTRQFTLGCIEIHGMQANARGLALLDFLLHGLARSGGHVQFQFLFRHGGGCPTAKAEMLIKQGAGFDDRSYFGHIEHRRHLLRETSGHRSKRKTPPLFKGGAKERWSGETDKRK